tara:strand:- start:288 stop:434 length:147 start_codon:yes stop_codon:yes gene_type:complete
VEAVTALGHQAAFVARTVATADPAPHLSVFDLDFIHRKLDGFCLAVLL